ncbi:hypothetical protein MTR67_023567 [Solanum verrucosum]|uniref:Reverse transcriptase zinc-binding domain-containing protein n=1 Tax=Solanum verrucosum TaxID=315347 RepID=A0AAF0QX36_SOLVR|nr:hypothetical protein MTR67_023567 [Solanum verrucosum]
MMKHKIKVEEYIGWQINSSSCSFWWDDWLGRGAIANYTSSVSSLNNATVAHFLVDGKWNERKLRQLVPPLLIPSILNTKIQLVQGIKDTTVWKQTEATKFSCTSAWDMCRTKKEHTILNAQIWHKYILFKISFLLWRALRYKLPTNEILAAFEVEPVKCFCCLKQGWDEVDHIFIQGHFAGKNVAQTTIIETLPIVICWNLWKNRCSAKYGGKLPGSWPEVVDCIAK